MNAPLSQSVKDALADAETLAFVCWRDLSAARHFGEAAGYTMRYKGRMDVDAPAFADEMAYKAARAAFRAVPALRGEEGGAK